MEAAKESPSGLVADRERKPFQFDRQIGFQLGYVFGWEMQGQKAASQIGRANSRVNLAGLHQRQLSASDIFSRVSVSEVPSPVFDQYKLIGVMKMIADAMMANKRAALQFNIVEGGVPPDPMG